MPDTAGSRTHRRLAVAGGSGVAAAVLLVGALHVVAADRVDPVRRTISEYAVGAGGILFDVGVLALALGSLAVLAALVRARLIPAVSAASLLLAAWAVGMGVVVAFEKTNWSVGPSAGGYIHRYASLVAFLALPVGALLVAHAQRGLPGSLRYRVCTRVLALASLGWFLPILGGFLLRPITGRPWWNAVPLGLMERGLALTEVSVVLTLAVWAASARRSAVSTPAPALGQAARA